MRDPVGRNASHREALESLAHRESLALHVLEMDVSRDESPEHAVEQALRIAGRIDVVINNAGIAAVGVTEGYTIEQWQQLFNVNLFGAARVNRAVLPIMRRQRSGLLIHVSSGAGRIVFPYFGAYCASKHALEALADAYRFELLPFGIDSVVVEPGIHRTPILENFIDPADESRLAGYASTAEYLSRIKAVFTEASRNPETPGPEPVVEAFVRLIETPFGQRPFRTVPTAAIRPLVEPLNTLAAGLRQTLPHAFNVPELADPQQSASAVG
jgi:NAD(P)-dependent dehydrogenase (short-subunit alcohol dehydrogenase family)